MELLNSNDDVGKGKRKLFQGSENNGLMLSIIMDLIDHNSMDVMVVQKVRNLLVEAAQRKENKVLIFGNDKHIEE